MGFIKKKEEERKSFFIKMYGSFKGRLLKGCRSDGWKNFMFCIYMFFFMNSMNTFNICSIGTMYVCDDRNIKTQYVIKCCFLLPINGLNYKTQRKLNERYPKRVQNVNVVRELLFILYIMLQGCFSVGNEYYLVFYFRLSKQYDTSDLMFYPSDKFKKRKKKLRENCQTNFPKHICSKNYFYVIKVCVN